MGGSKDANILLLFNFITLKELFMIKIGDRVVIGEASIIIPDGEVAVISYKFDESDDVTFSLAFSDLPESEEDEKSPYVNITGSGDRSSFVFRNFNSATGHTLGSPIVFATSDAGENISFLATVYKYKRSRRITYQVMLGGKDE